MNHEHKTIEEIDRYFTDPFWRGYKWHIYASLEMLNGASPIVKFRSRHWSAIYESQTLACELANLPLTDMQELFGEARAPQQDVYACRFSQQAFTNYGYLPVSLPEKVILSCSIGVARKQGYQLIMEMGIESGEFQQTNQWWSTLFHFRDEVGQQIQRYAIDLEQLRLKHTRPVDVLCAYQVKSTEHGPIIREIEKRAAQLKSEEVIADVPEPTNPLPGWSGGR